MNHPHSSDGVLCLGVQVMSSVHDDSIVIDGLIIAKWDRSIFEDMRNGGLAAASCTVSVWEGFQGTVNNIRSEEHTSELQSLMRISYAVFCLKKQRKQSLSSNLFYILAK